MFLKDFYNRDGQLFQITPEQASQFAKSIADDYNPIHDPDARRFCVPGDLLFALVLSEYGVSQEMSFSFDGMLGANRQILFPDAPGETFAIQDAESAKVYLNVKKSGAVTTCPELAESLIRGYVAFSGHNFPHILVPLMEQHGVMINPARPLVMYDSMSLTLDTLDFSNPELSLVETSLQCDEKRGDVTLRFAIKSQDRVVGHGSKKLVLSGLRPFCCEQIKKMQEEYEGRKALLQPV